MIDYLKGLWARFEVHWHAVAAVFVTVVPALLDKLNVIDLHPILDTFMNAQTADALIGLLPLVMVFMKPLLKVNPHPDDVEPSA